MCLRAARRTVPVVLLARRSGASLLVVRRPRSVVCRDLVLALRRELNQRPCRVLSSPCRGPMRLRATRGEAPVVPLARWWMLPSSSLDSFAPLSVRTSSSQRAADVLRELPRSSSGTARPCRASLDCGRARPATSSVVGSSTLSVNLPPPPSPLLGIVADPRCALLPRAGSASRERPALLRAVLGHRDPSVGPSPLRPLTPTDQSTPHRRRSRCR